jgi:hypothetical protein
LYRKRVTNYRRTQLILELLLRSAESGRNADVLYPVLEVIITPHQVAHDYTSTASLIFKVRTFIQNRNVFSNVVCVSSHLVQYSVWTADGCRIKRVGERGCRCSPINQHSSPGAVAGQLHPGWSLDQVIRSSCYQGGVWIWQHEVTAFLAQVAMCRVHHSFISWVPGKVVNFIFMVVSCDLQTSAMCWVAAETLVVSDECKLKEK